MPTQNLSALALELRSRVTPGAGAPLSRPVPGPCSPDCQYCGGSGWLRTDAEVGDPNFGKLVLCPNVKLIQDFSRCGLDAEDRQLTWSSIEDAEGSNAVEAAKITQGVLESARGWCYLYGRPGLAKSAILKVAVAEALRAGREAAYVQASEVLDNLKAAFDAVNPSLEAAERFEYWSSLPVLAIDELDKISETAWVRQVRFSLLNRRYEDAAKGRSVTLFASQSSPLQLPEELASRVLDGRFKTVRLLGEDYRAGMYWLKD